ncbi:neuralized-like protein 4 isoform X2 [Spodoptera frugiperda]|uniref:Neuralized-like protein 4 isoform X2 n=1 Tax=Spodoptera frugiperda TaxID=7108 RepID=A0A9R0E861_SPOFR|nr:neuralized-like protein 4 isoform X2 [Spodoptera frugiperda]
MASYFIHIRGKNVARLKAKFENTTVEEAERCPVPARVVATAKRNQRSNKIVNVWNGSLEIGVTTLDPEFMELPATATKLRNTAWIMSGSSIVKDGVTLVNSYGPELDTLREGDCIGVMRTSKGELTFYLNGRCLGIAARDLPSRLFAVIDLYGQCVQVSILRSNEIRPIMDSSIEQIEEDPNNDDTLTSSEMDVAGLPPESSQYPKEPHTVYIPMPSEGACALVPHDRLRFHPRCGILVKLSSNNKTAERARPLDDYNNGVVMTHRPLYDNELFEIRIDRLVDKWSGSIEVGVTTHNPATIRFPSTMTNMDTGTIMMSGCKVLLNGHGTCMEYGNFNLDELREGDTVGMMRKSNGKLHYFINGIDQGVATDKVDQQVWGVVDLYGMTVKVSIVDPCEDLDSNINNPPLMLASPEIPAPSNFRPPIDEESLLFHTLRDSNVIIINDGKTAHRPNAFKYFNNGIVMTNRTLKTNELFQVRLDLVIPKWAGSIEIGVTQHSSNDIKFPFKMSNAKSGTWAVTGEDVIRDGTIIIPQYVRNLNKLVEGDTVGVMRKELGILHFFVNGVDQGPAAFNVPEHVFGIVDLYGRAAQATIVDEYTPPPIYSPESPLSSESNATIFPEMCFHRVHGRNARLSRNRLTAWRATVYSEFNDAVLFSSRPLRECDMFELRIDKMVDCWIGSLEIGVTAIRPDDLEASGGVGAIAGTATDLNWDTYILSGAAMMKDGECVRSGYPLDLDTLTVGSRVGMMWHADRSLHYYLDGMDMGKAWYVPHLNIYAVVDLYGQCTQVTILQNEERVFNYNGCTNSDNSMLSNSRAMSSPPPPYWSFSEYAGDNVCLLHDYTVARRLTSDPTAALVFSSAHLALGELFEVKILECKHSYAGSFRIGITDINILNAHVNRSLPPSVACLPHFTAYIDGRFMKYSYPNTRKQEIYSFVPSFEWLRPGDRIGLKKINDSRVIVFYNSEPLDTCFERVPDKVYVVIELYGHVTKIQAVSQGVLGAGLNQTTIPNDGEDFSKHIATPLNLGHLSSDNTDEVFDIHGSLAGAGCPLVGIRPRTSDRTFDSADDPGEDTTSDDSVGDDLAEDEASATEDDIMGRKNKAPILKGKYAKLAAQAAQAAAEAQAAARAEARAAAQAHAHGKGKGKGKRGKTSSPPKEVPAASTSAEPSTPGAVADVAAPVTATSCSGSGSGSGAEAEEGGNQDDEPPAGPSTEPPFDLSEPLCDPSAEPVPEPVPELEPEPSPSRNNLPYTFFNIHGVNIKLCSSDTVAMRYQGYKEGLAVVSQPLRRGHNFRFRVDKMCDEWVGTISIGAVGTLPSEPIRNGIPMETPCWMLSSEMINDNGTFYHSLIGMVLEDLTEQSVLTLHFRFTSELVLQVNGKLIGCIATIPRRFSQIYPAVDLYGTICQVSVLLHPYVITSGASLDLPVISEFQEETFDGLSDDEAEAVSEGQTERKRKKKAYSQDNLINDEDMHWEPPYMPAGPSHGLSFTPYRVPTPLPYRTPSPYPKAGAKPLESPEPIPVVVIKKKYKKSKNKDARVRAVLAEAPMYTSLNLPLYQIADNNEMVNRCIKKSHSTHNFSISSDDQESCSSLRHTSSMGSQADDDRELRRRGDMYRPAVATFLDTNIRHNDRYPEVSDVDNLDNEIVDALTMETGNLPDLTEEQSSSFENSRRDDYWADALPVEYMRYLNRIMCLDQDGAACQSLESEWEASGQGCEHLHLVLKYWNHLVVPHPELRQAVSWGQVRCYCANCFPDDRSPFAGWVRIERIDGVGAAQRGFWHVVRHTLSAAQADGMDRGPVRRPRGLYSEPVCTLPFHDVWMDDEGKPHHSLLCIEIDIEGSNDENDRLLAFLIYLRPQLTFPDDYSE